MSHYEVVFRGRYKDMKAYVIGVAAPDFKDAELLARTQMLGLGALSMTDFSAYQTEVTEYPEGTSPEDGGAPSAGHVRGVHYRVVR